MNQSFTGFWKTPNIDTGESEYFHISKSGRYVHAVLHQNSKMKYQMMRLWLKTIGDEFEYEVCNKPNSKNTWKLRFSVSDHNLLIQREERDFVCQRVLESEAPAWFIKELQYSHNLMEKQEVEQ